MTTGVGKTALPYTDILGAELQTLPEALKVAGYETFALTSNPFLISEFGFAQGFDISVSCRSRASSEALDMCSLKR
jgi:arylsulfatase A-like enzyme